MTLQLDAIPPFVLTLPTQNAALPKQSNATASAGTSALPDIRDIKVPIPGGTFTVESGDVLAVRDLFSAGATSVATYRLAMRDDPATPGGGKLLLQGRDVTGQVDFTPDEFQQLQFQAGPNGASTDLVVVARTGKPNGNGGLTDLIDSPAVQITAQTTGKRSIDAATAFRGGTATTPGDADITRIVQESNIFNGYGATRPALTTVGNFTAESGDVLAVRDLFSAGATNVATYRLGMRDDPSTPGGGKLLLQGRDVTGQVDFTPDEFQQLQFQAGPNGASTDLVVVARTGKPDGNGGLTDLIDSPAVQITAETTGERSINAATAFRGGTATTPGDADITRIVQESNIFNGFGATRPALTTAGNFTAESGDTLAVRDLFSAGATNVATYRLATRDDPSTPGGGKLLLQGRDVTGQVDFTPEEFQQLQFQAGPNGASTDFVIVARTGKPNGNGGLTDLIDSPAIQITGQTTGARSINAATAFRGAGAATPGDADITRIVQESNIFNGFGATRPALTTAGNLTAVSGDTLAVRDLFSAGTANVATYRLAMRDDPSTPGRGKLLLQGRDVTGQVDFTPDEFQQLQFQAGPNGASTDLVVVARTGKPNVNGTLTDLIDSPAVQITARTTGARSINAATAFRSTNTVSAGDADITRIVQESDIFTGFGATRPALTTVGNFTAESGDLLAVRALFSAGATDVASYRLATRDDPSTPGGGKLLLQGRDVTGQVDFTPEEFQQLQFQAGPDGASTDFVIVARTGKPNGNGDLIDSPAIQITAQTTGTRSINAATAFRASNTVSTGDTDITRIVQESNIFNGFGATRPTLTTSVPAGELQSSPRQLAASLGGYRQSNPLADAQTTASSTLSDLVVGASDLSTPTQSAAAARNASALAALLSNGVGGFTVANRSQATALLALQAYQRSSR